MNWDSSLALNAVLFAITLHLIGDWFLQNNWMSQGKSKKFLPLFTHCAVVAVAFIPMGFLIGWTAAIAFAAINGVTHFFIDYATSRLTHKLWDQGKIWRFFRVIGIDQWMHGMILFTALAYLTN